MSLSIRQLNTKKLKYLSMNISSILILSWLTITWCYPQCPEKCVCSLDIKGRIQTICNAGRMNTIPISAVDPKVEVLIVRGPRNDITIGPIFGTFKNLEILRITDSNVPSVGFHSFWGVPSLRILDLSRNNITSLADNSFKGQERLNELDLSHNKIAGMTSWVFKYLKDLRRLNLADNSIDELVPRVFYMLNKLKYLDLSDNPLIDLPPDVFKDITDLKELRCRNCNLKKINPKVYNALPRLMELDLGDNNLKYIDEDDFKVLRHLTNLHLNGNHLTAITNNLLMAQKSLEYLDLSRNRLVNITNGAFINLLNLTYLDLSYNKLVNLESASMAPLKKLHSLNISGNIDMDLFAVRQTFHLLHQLRTLFVADMNTLPMDILNPFSQLRSLNLSGNHLFNTSLIILEPVENLQLLDLSRNQLNGFDDAHVLKLQNIKDVKLENNPLICDRCHMGTLIDRARMLHWNLYPTCFLPENLRGAPISDLDSNELEECTKFIDDERHDAASVSENILLAQGNLNLFIIVCGIAFVLIAIIILIGVLSITRHSAKYYTHEEKRNDGMYEKSMDSLSITGNELSFKFPMDDVISTIDDMILPPKPIKSFSK